MPILHLEYVTRRGAAMVVDVTGKVGPVDVHEVCRRSQALRFGALGTIDGRCALM